MKSTEMMDLGARLDGIIYKRDLNILTRYIDARARAWEKEVKLDMEQSNEFDGLYADIANGYFAMGFMAGQMFDITDPDLSEKFGRFREALVNDRAFEVIPLAARKKKAA